MTIKNDYQAAVARADERKAQLIHNAKGFKERISPARLKADVKANVRAAIQDSKSRAKATVRRHPVAVGVIGTGLLAWLFRRPIGRLIEKLGSARNRSQQPPASLPPVDPEQPTLEDASVETAESPPPVVTPAPAPDQAGHNP